MKRISTHMTCFLLLILCFSFIAEAQVGINNDNSDPDESAMLDIKSTTKGFLPPRMSKDQRDAIITPAQGLIIYQTDGKTGLHVYNGSEWSKVSPDYNVGDFAHGGVVFWVDKTGHHGLVCAKTDQNSGNSARWYAGTYGQTRALGDGPFSGAANTVIIISSFTAIGDDGLTYAARICNELEITEEGKTYGDWYLPSKGELQLMYQNKTIVDSTAQANGGSSFSSSWYWSSIDYDEENAEGLWFLNGSTGSMDKNVGSKVRAVRAF